MKRLALCVALLPTALACAEPAPAITCGEGTTLDGDACVAEEPAECPAEIECGVNAVLVGDVCEGTLELACGENTTQVGDECVADCPVGLTCGEDTVEEDGVCVVDVPVPPTPVREAAFGTNRLDFIWVDEGGSPVLAGDAAGANAPTTEDTDVISGCSDAAGAVCNAAAPFIAASFASFYPFNGNQTPTLTNSAAQLQASYTVGEWKAARATAAFFDEGTPGRVKLRVNATGLVKQGTYTVWAFYTADATTGAAWAGMPLGGLPNSFTADEDGNGSFSKSVNDDFIQVGTDISVHGAALLGATGQTTIEADDGIFIILAFHSSHQLSGNVTFENLEDRIVLPGDNRRSTFFHVQTTRFLPLP